MDNLDYYQRAIEQTSPRGRETGRESFPKEERIFGLESPGLRMQRDGCLGLFLEENHKFTSCRCQARNLNGSPVKHKRK